MYVNLLISMYIILFPAFYNKYNDFFDYINKYFEKKKKFPNKSISNHYHEFNNGWGSLMFIKFLEYLLSSNLPT